MSGLLTRRAIFIGSVAVAGGVALSGCTLQTQQVPPEVTQIVSDIQLAVQGLQQIIPQILAQFGSGIPTQAISTINADLSTVQMLLAQLQANLNDPALQRSVLQQIETDLNGTLAILAHLPIPAPYLQVIQAAAVFVPEIEAYLAQQFGMKTGLLPAIRPTMSRNQARDVLHAAIASRRLQ